MKFIKYMIFMIVFLFSNILFVHASCTDNEINNLKELANDIKITYKHMGIIENEEYIDYNSFEVNIKNFNDDFYILYLADTEKIKPTNETASVTLTSGNWNFKVFSNKCDIELSVINFKLPKFNMYSLDPLCEGIDGSDFALCGKYYEYDVSYDNFKKRVEYYRSTHNINVDDNKVENEKNINLVLDKIFDYIVKYHLYIVIISIVLSIVLISIFMIMRKKKRGVLE